MSYVEAPVIFDCAGEALLGIVSRPTRPATIGVLVLVGGPQTRVGSHRQFVLLARRLAADGYAVLRFDFRGMGDSSGDMRAFDAVGDDIAAALDALQSACPEVGAVVLWGLCDAASAALLYCHDRPDPRIVGLCLLNPWVRSEATLARTRVKHYYRERVLQPEFWTKLIRGKTNLAIVAGDLVRTLRLSVTPAVEDAGEVPFQTRMARALVGFPGKILLVLSGRDYTAKEFIERATSDPAWSGALARSGLARHEVPDADHTFSSVQAREEVERTTLAWLQELKATGRGWA